MQFENQKGINPIHTFINRIRIPESYKAESRKFTSKVPLKFERAGFTVKTAQTECEFKKVLQLRYEIFHREFKGTIFPFGIDFEPLDILADHLLVIENHNQKIVGTYRLICSSFSNEFYSQSEFNLGGFLEVPGVKLEMSRACIHKNFRSGVTMALLWRGVSEYIKKVNASFVFGCASVKTWSPKAIREVLKQLKLLDCLSNSFTIFPRSEYEMPKAEPLFRSNRNVAIPSLMKGYLKAGAKLVPLPAWDKEFRCVDFLTILETSQMKKTFEKRYLSQKREDL